MKADHGVELKRLRSDLEAVEACLSGERAKSTKEIKERVDRLCSEHRSEFLQATINLRLPSVHPSGLKLHNDGTHESTVCLSINTN